MIAVLNPGDRCNYTLHLFLVRYNLFWRFKAICVKHCAKLDICHNFPLHPVVVLWFLQYHEDGARIEAAFRRYIHRADSKQTEDSYEIIVCHANVIRYFVCRLVPHVINTTLWSCIAQLIHSD